MITVSTSLFTAFISLITAIFVVSLQFLLKRHLEKKRHLKELSSKSYMDYLRYVSEQNQLHPERSPEEYKESFVKIASAKAGVCLYGSPKVIEAFSEFEKLGASLVSSSSSEAFKNMVYQMRLDSGGDSGVSKKDLGVLLGIR